MQKKDVLVIFKTHLDVGFTDYSENIVNNYLNNFIPNAIRVGYELKDTDTPFVWTVGSWLIWKALKEDKTGMVEKAVADGILNWHGLPFTTHTELMSSKLFEFGIDISKELDERFGRKTIAAKMTDVPGHTIGMVPIMKKCGIEFLHLGINPATPVPPVPTLFKWKTGEDFITVMYQGAYGSPQEFDDFVVYFAHTNDNQGPQSKDEIIEIYEKIKEKYPNCNVKAATLNDVAERIRNISDIPVLEKEIGDTWIHGGATDPQKLSRYRRVLREFEKISSPDKSLRENLLLVPEHTWGMNVMLHFPYEENYTYREMEKCKKEREKIEKSWAEQRKYVEDAEKVLGLLPDYNAQAPDLTGFEKTDDEPVCEISWQIFDNEDYKRYKNDYLRLNPDEVFWVKWDYTKPGLPDYKGGIYTPSLKGSYKKGNKKVFELAFEKEIAEEYGLPHFYITDEDSKIEIVWLGKKDSRQPQACWVKFRSMDENWEISKMDKWINPEEIIGSPLITAFDKGVRNKDTEITALDSALVAPFGRKLLHYNEKDLKQDLYFNLYNNIWNTNFMMWYSDDSVFRFEIKKR